jgi:hypothetical protein
VTPYSLVDDRQWWKERLLIRLFWNTIVHFIMTVILNYIFMIHSNIVLPSTPRSPQVSVFYKLSSKVLFVCCLHELQLHFTLSFLLTCSKKGNTLYRSRAPGGWGFQDYLSAHEGGKALHRPPLTPLLPPPEGWSQCKIWNTPSRIEPVTFRLLAYCLNELV